jgi:hypothetical protein
MLKYNILLLLLPPPPPCTMLQGNFVKIFNNTQTLKNFFVLKFELILIIGSNNVLTEGARKVHRGRRVGQG